MSNTQELEILAERMTEAMPPPERPIGVNYVVPGSGRWKVARIGAGQYAIRAIYKSSLNNSEIEIRMADEIRGYPTAVATALRFAVSVAEAGRMSWSRA